MRHAIVTIFFIVVITNNTNSANNSASFKSADDFVEETQHAICKIITQEIETSANATVKRQLKGVCTTKQIERKFQQLERKLLAELNRIITLLENERGVTVANQDLLQTTNYDYANYGEKSLDDDANIFSVSETITRQSSWERTDIYKLNDTISVSNGEKVYNYYWKIPKIHSILRRNGVLFITSPHFYVLGHRLYTQLYPNYQNTNYLGIQLRPSRNFLKKHRFTILEQFDTSRDINSQTLDGASNFEVMYKVPYEKLEERNYLHNDTMIIKITIYLNL